MNRNEKKSVPAKERRYKAFDLKKTGKSYRAIGKELGCSQTQALRDVVRVLREMRPPQEDVDHHRGMLVTRYEMILERLFTEFETAGALALPAILDRILKTLNQIADITGVKEKSLVVKEKEQTADLTAFADILKRAHLQ